MSVDLQAIKDRDATAVVGVWNGHDKQDRTDLLCLVAALTQERDEARTALGATPPEMADYGDMATAELTITREGSVHRFFIPSVHEVRISSGNRPGGQIVSPKAGWSISGWEIVRLPMESGDTL